MLIIWKALFYKHYLVRKRKWKTTLFLEIGGPILSILCLFYINHVMSIFTVTDQKDQIHQAKPLKFSPNFTDVSRIAYAPNDNFTRTLMKQFKDCAIPNIGEYIFQLPYKVVSPQSWLFSESINFFSKNGAMKRKQLRADFSP